MESIWHGTRHEMVTLNDSSWLLPSSLVSYCCCSRLLQTWWLKTTHTVLKVRRLKWFWMGQNQGISQAAVVWRLWGRICVCFFLSGFVLFSTFFSTWRPPSFFFWLEAPFCLWSQQWHVHSTSHCVTRTLIFLPFSFVYGDDDVCPAWIIQDNLPISSSADEQT